MDVNWVRLLFATVLLASVGVTGGCFSSNPEDIQAFVKPYEVNVTAENYILEPPDEIEIHCAQVPEVDQQRQRIRPDGAVSFEGIGEVEAAGKTPGQLADMLKEKVAKLYSVMGDHPVDVRIVGYGSKVFYVMGQVARPGPLNYTGRDTVLTALAATQPSPTAWKSRIQVVRPAATEDVPPRIFEMDLNKAMIHGDTSKDVLLQEGDIVYVPPTIPAAIAMVLEEFITPIARAFYGAYLIQNPPGTYQGGYSPITSSYWGR
jgi:polysaccharide export outer membrane protein